VTINVLFETLCQYHTIYWVHLCDFKEILTLEFPKVVWQHKLLLLLSFITPNDSTGKNTIIYTKYKNTFTKQNIKTDYKLRLLQ